MNGTMIIVVLPIYIHKAYRICSQKSRSGTIIESRKRKKCGAVAHKKGFFFKCSQQIFMLN